MNNYLEMFARTIYKNLESTPFLYSDFAYTVNKYRKVFGSYPDLKNPETFNEKITVKKLYDRSPRVALIADKIKTRAYVADIIGGQYLPQLFRVIRKEDQFSMDYLPQQFVLKATHGSGMIKFVRDKEQEDPRQLKRLCRKWLRTNFYTHGREWCYQHLEPGVMVEELLLQGGHTPIEYDFFCFHGKVKLLEVFYDRFHDPSTNFFDKHGKLVDLKFVRKNNPGNTSLPANYSEMVKLVEQISREFDFLRVDLFSIKGKIYFGECTNYPGNGRLLFYPPEYDLKLGSYWQEQEYLIK